MRSRLLSKYGINRPATIDVNLKAILFEERNEIGALFLTHNCSLAARAAGLLVSVRVQIAAPFAENHVRRPAVAVYHEDDVAIER